MSKQPRSDAWAFLVVSDPGQADTLLNQEAWAEEVSRANKWPLTKTISGVSSGKFGARKLTTAMIADLEALRPEQRPGRVLMIRLERLGRGDGLEAMEAFLRIRRLGIVVHTRLDGDVGYDKASELLMPMLRFFVGGMENEVRRDKLNAYYDRKRAAHAIDPTIAIANKLPYGLALKDGHFVPQAPEDAAVRLAYELKVQGYGNHRIGKRLAQVAPPMILRNGKARPQSWTSERVSRLISKTCYRGTIVDAETWQRAQRRIREISRPTRILEYPLGGALRCACGYALIGFGKRNCKWRYYCCRFMANHDGHMRFYRANELEEQFADLLKRLVADDALLLGYAAEKNNAADTTTLKATLAGLRGEHSRLQERRSNIFSAFEDGALKREDLQWRLDDLGQKQSELEARIRSLEEELDAAIASTDRIEDVRALVASAHDNWLVAAIDDRRALAKAISNAVGGLIVTFAGELQVGVPIPDRRRSFPYEERA